MNNNLTKHGCLKSFLFIVGIPILVVLLIITGIVIYANINPYDKYTTFQYNYEIDTNKLGATARIGIGHDYRKLKGMYLENIVTERKAVPIMGSDYSLLKKSSYNQEPLYDWEYSSVEFDGITYTDTASLNALRLSMRDRDTTTPHENSVLVTIHFKKTPTIYWHGNVDRSLVEKIFGENGYE